MKYILFISLYLFYCCGNKQQSGNVYIVTTCIYYDCLPVYLFPIVGIKLSIPNNEIEYNPEFYWSCATNN